MMVSKPRIGISSCLLGHKVRHDGCHKHYPFITRTLGRHVEWIPVCPEFEVGMGVPRETVRLIGSPASPKMIADRTGKDWSRQMGTYSAKRVRKLKAMNLSGYILKKNSPSCGMEKVRVYGLTGTPHRKGRGLFAQTLMTRLPLLPVEEEGRLYDPGFRENFIERVFGYYRWQALASNGRSLRRLVEFHSQEKLLLLAHSESHVRRLGRVVAQAKRKSMGTVMEKYGRLFMEALGHRATTRTNTIVLRHMMVYFSTQLSSDERKELFGVIGDYTKSMAPLVVPLTLMRHCAGKYNVVFLLSQSYLQPHPQELMLRNHV